jgi:hypothetical protein
VIHIHTAFQDSVDYGTNTRAVFPESVDQILVVTCRSSSR